MDVKLKLMIFLWQKQCRDNNGLKNNKDAETYQEKRL